MKVKFIKKLLKYNPGDVTEVTEPRGKYLISIKAAEVASEESNGVAKEVKKSPVKKAAKKKVAKKK